jgi:hypothetical protein
VYERHYEPLLPFKRFLRRQVKHVLIGLAAIGASLALGVLGYHVFEKLPWLDALVNASMILGGMGPVSPIATTAGKIFASFYALYSGVVFLVVVGVMMAPLVHRFLHRLHLEKTQRRS